MLFCCCFKEEKQQFYTLSLYTYLFDYTVGCSDQCEKMFCLPHLQPEKSKFIHTPRRHSSAFWKEIYSKIIKLIIINKNIDEHLSYLQCPSEKKKAWNELLEKEQNLDLQLPLWAPYKEKAEREVPVVPPALERYACINESSKAETLEARLLLVPST